MNTPLSTSYRAIALALLLPGAAAQLPAQATAAKLDRAKRPTAGPGVTLRIPKVQRRTLSNGVDVAVMDNFIYGEPQPAPGY